MVDEHTFRIDLPQPDRFALPNLALTYPIIVNSKLAKSHATADDPWASKWLINNEAGGGAFKIDSFSMGERILFSRFDEWKSGPLPQFQRVLWQTVPAAESRVASLRARRHRHRPGPAAQGCRVAVQGRYRHRRRFSAYR